MSTTTISIFGNKILLEIMIELKFFSNFKINFIDNLNSYLKDQSKQDEIIVFFNNSNEKEFIKVKEKKIPILLITKNKTFQSRFTDDLIERINIPFKAVELKKKITSLLARHEFKIHSLIELNGYIIDKNERKIKKNDIELQLTEKETNFLILFSKNQKPLNKDFLLNKVWKYSLESDTHTVETHIHRLRKKISEKFSDNNFIKNNNEGYFI
tara:strand:- start:348 stop:983 length:636 start_codon:yes stop_codon:yes gene_type:complete